LPEAPPELPPPAQFCWNRIIHGDARQVLPTVPAASIDLSFWSPPYFVGKSYEQGWRFEDWQSLLEDVIGLHARILKPGGFMAVNIGDILCFTDKTMPRYQADNIRRKKIAVTREEILRLQAQFPTARRADLAKMLDCSEQTIQRRLEHNNVRGGKQRASTRVKLTGAMLEEWALAAGLYLYDQRIWHKDPCWANCRWHSNSYRAVDEFEHVYIFWQPGITQYDRSRLTKKEWADWGSRGVWKIPSVARNDRHEAEFPELLAQRVIRLFSSAAAIVLDPFVGAGTTTAVAQRLGRSWLGIEINAQYAELARKRSHGT